MRILKLSPYYEPELISSTHLTRDLENAYVKAGFEIEIYAPTPTRGVTANIRNEYKKKKYEEKANGAIRIHRFAMLREDKNPFQRVLRYVLCNVVQYWKGIHAKGIDLIMAGSTPPTQGMLCALVKKRLSKKYRKYVPFIYNLQDVFPDSLVTTGLIREDSLLYKIGRKIENYTYRNADIIITISEDMKRNIIGKGVTEEKIKVIYNWIDTETIVPISDDDNRLFDEYKISKDKFRIVYAGNLGLAQGIDTVLEAARLVTCREDIEFLIFGEGVASEQLQKDAGRMENVRFFPLLPSERVPEVYSLGNACLVCCKKGTGHVGVPSKTWSIMACERPVLASFDMDSELTRIISSAEAGLCSGAGDAKLLATNILRLYEDHTLCLCMGKNARKYVVNNVEKSKAVHDYIELINRTAG